MTHRTFYRRLFRPLVKRFGPIDPETLLAIIGFDVGGPLNFCTIGAKARRRYVTYVSCELAVRPEQRPSSLGHFELLTTCDDLAWVRQTLTAVGAMSLHETLDHGHTIDIGLVAGRRAPLQGILLETLYKTTVASEPFAVLRCIGVTRPEMEFAEREGSDALIALLTTANIYPNTCVGRPSVVPRSATTSARRNAAPH